MALRVLLADNSETIKKVIQLTLQDFAMDLRIVTLGVDVLDVALQFKPDIIFVDILLQKKNGYEVSKELKNNVHLKNTPVVLMWSGFMEFDEPKAKESLADARLEKPFDADTLKNLVTSLVKKQAPADISNFLDFPSHGTPTKPVPPTSASKTERHEDPLKSLDKIKSEAEKFQPDNLKKPVASGKFKPIELPNLADVIDNFETKNPQEDEFEMQPLDKTTGFGYRKPAEPEADKSLHQTKSFIINLPDDAGPEEIPLEIEPIDSVEDMSFLLNPESIEKETQAATKITTRAPELKKVEPPKIPTSAPTHTATAAPKAPTASQAPIPTPEDIERIVREEVREAIEKMVWQVVPEMATQLIKKELDRLLKDNESKP